VIFCLLLVTPGIAWTVQDMTVEPAEGTVAPRALVTVSYTVRFDPAMEATGRTFDAGHTLDMATELNGATWSATLVNIGKSRDPVTTPLGARTGSRYQIKGSTLSYDDAELNLIVTIRGIAPDVLGQEKTIVTIRELDGNGEQVMDVGETVTYLVAVPTTTVTTLKTPLKTVTVATETTARHETTRAPEDAGGTATQTVRQTYAPGPDPVSITGILVVTGIIAGRIRQRRSICSVPGEFSNAQPVPE